MNVGSLFSGIGGFDLGFERAGMRTAFFVERDRYCQAVLRKHWPGVPIFDDVESVGAHNLPAVDLLCGGFPCQDISAAGKGGGLDGARSGLWSEFHRIIGELRPRYVVVENVPLLRSRGLGRILGEMAAIGYDAEWDCIPACAVGAPHRRDRIWIVAYPQRAGLERQRPEPGQPQEPEPRHGGASDPDADSRRQQIDPQLHPVPGVAQGARGDSSRWHDTDGLRDSMADAERERRQRGSQRECGAGPCDSGRPGIAADIAPTERREGGAFAEDSGDSCGAWSVADAEAGIEQDGRGRQRVRDLPPHSVPEGREARQVPPVRGDRNGDRGRSAVAGGSSDALPSEWWLIEPDVGRVAYGVPNRVDRLAALGNSLIPQIAEWIGRQIIEWEALT